MPPGYPPNGLCTNREVVADPRHSCTRSLHNNQCSGTLIAGTADIPIADPRSRPADPWTAECGPWPAAPQRSNTFTTALDRSTNTIARNTVFEGIPPTKCRFVRLTMTDWPRTAPLRIIELTVFGKATESLPPAHPIPRAQ
jgi:hypothetical protein